MTRLERFIDWLLFAYLGAVCTLLVLPVLALALLLKLADGIDLLLAKFGISTDEKPSSKP